MIDPRDIQDLAAELSLRPNIVEKDYVLGWLLAGIGSDEYLSDSWVFKGGTCLKKVHFETYRFSEDLDFTVRQTEHMDESFLLERFRGIADWIYDHCGIELPGDQLRFEIYTSKRGGLSAEGRVYYRGPLQAPRSLPKIKLDLTVDEVVVMEPERRRVFHPYADAPEDGIHVSCYAYTEIFAEKTRALHERGRPRDLYDVINLFRREDARAQAVNIHDVLQEKCKFKGIEFPTLDSVQAYEASIRGAWEPMLGHQLPVLPPLENFWSELPAFFDWLHGKKIPMPKPSYKLAAGEQLIQVPLGALASFGLGGTPLETIRFAAANHLCVELDYVDRHGVRSTRIIEPYSLRRAGNGEIYLHAERTNGVQGDTHRQYKVANILGARATTQSFTPQHAIELTPGAFQPIPTAVAPIRAEPGRPARRRRALGSGPIYVYRCAVCGKRFERKRQTTTLNPHENKTGSPCPGRAAMFVTTR